MKNYYQTSLKGIFILLSFFYISNKVFSQEVYEWSQDGKIIFQLKQKSTVSIPSDSEGLVNFKEIAFLSNLVNKYEITKVSQKHPDIANIDLRLTYEIMFNKHKDVDLFIGELNQLHFIQYAERKELHKLSLTPNDTYYNTTNMWHLFKINAGQAWDISTGSTTVVVAITDNAIQVTHTDLSPNIVAGRDVADGDNNTNPPSSATSWTHGTHVSGTSGSATNNSAGVASIGFNIKIMPIKIAQDATGSITAGYEGITWAAQNGADVINMSWGGGSSSSYGLNVVNNAYNLGCVLVAAAGNDNVQTLHYPAAYSNVISVASTASNDAKSSFSQYGNWIDISAPGSSIRSTTLTNGYGLLSGTSMASPLVAGLCGLILSVNPTLTPAQVKSCLQSSADNIDSQNSGYIGKLGAGRINAYASMICANASTIAIDAAVESISSPGGSSCNGTFTPVLTIKNYGANTLTSATINYQINTGPVSTYNWTGSLATSASANITLPVQTTVNGMHTFNANTSNPNGSVDGNLTNDASSMPFSVALINVFPYFDNFETGGNFWSHSAAGIQNTNINIYPGDKWQLGIPAGTVLNSAYSGTKVYATNLSGTYDYSTYNYLQSPCYDFTSLNQPRVEFRMAFKIELDWDALYFEYSTNNGSTWTKLGTASSPNWYNSALVGDGTNTGLLCNGAQWTGTSSNWLLYGHDLSFLAGQATVKFRFNMATDEYVEEEGVMVDDFTIYDMLPTGLNEKQTAGIHLFPNPSNGYLTLNVKLNSVSPVTVRVYNLLGELMQEIKNSNFRGGKMEIDLSDHANGIYMIEVKTGDAIFIKKVTLNK